MNRDRLATLDLYGVLALAIAVPLLLGSMVLVRADGGTALWFSVFCLSLLLVLPLLHAALRRHFDPLEPIYIVCLAYFLYFVYSPARDFMQGHEFYFGVFVTPLMPKGAVYLGIGLLAMYLGYYARTGERLAARMRPPTEARNGAIVAAIVIAIGAVLLFGSWVQASGMSWMRLLSLGQLGETPATESSAGAFSGTLDHYLFSTLDWFTSAFLIGFAFMRRHRWTLIPAFIAVFLLYSTVGLRFRVLIFALAPLVYWYLASGRRPRLPHLALAGAVAVLIIGGIGSIRTQIRLATTVDVEELSVAAAQESFQRDLSIYQPYLVLVENMPSSVDFVYGRSFAYLLAHPIPRRLWSGKPEAPVLGIIRETFGGNAAVQAGVAYPNIGEYYANFGVLGIVIGMMLFGLLMRWLWEYTIRYQHNPWVRCIYGIALPMLVVAVSRGYFVQIVTSTAFFLGPLLIAMWLVKRRAAARARQQRRPWAVVPVS